MQPIIWSPEYDIGVDSVDTQHREIIDKINRLAIGIDPDHDTGAAHKLLEELGDYVRHHFKNEEGLMARGGCDPAFEVRHRSEHAYYRGVLRDFMHDYIDGRSRITASFIEYLVHWLLHHIVSTDREMVDHLTTIPPEHPARPPTQSFQAITAELGASERQLLHDLHHANVELEARVAAYGKEIAELRAQLETAQQRIDALNASPGGRHA